MKLHSKYRSEAFRSFEKLDYYILSSQLDAHMNASLMHHEQKSKTMLGLVTIVEEVGNKF